MTVPAYIIQNEDSPDQPGGTRMRFEGAVPRDGEAEVLVHNISELGLVLEADHDFAIGFPIEVKLPHSGAARARVAWKSGKLTGFSFDMPISRVSLGAKRLRDAVTDNFDMVNTARHLESFGMRVQRLRLELGMSQGQLAKLMGVSDPAVCGWELNRTRPKPGRMEALATILKVSLAELLGQQELMATLPAQIASARETIARAAGVSEDRVKITIEL